MELAIPRLREFIIALIIGLCLSTGMVSGQDRENVYLTRISIREGLTQAAVKAVYQDAQGFIWVGTEEGLNRYDGTGFLNFYHEPEDANTLPHNWVSCIIEDGDNHLWVGTQGGGIARYDEGANHFISFKNNPEDSQTISSDIIRAMFADERGTIWVGTRSHGLNAFNPITGKVTRYGHNPEDMNSLSSNRIRSIVDDGKGGLWIGTDGGGLNRFDADQKTFTRYQADPDDPNSLPSNRIRTLLLDRDGSLWIGSYDNFLVQRDKTSGQFQVFRNNPNDPFSLSAGKVISILRDSRGVLWVGTEGGGLDRMGEDGRSFHHYRHNPGNQHSLSDNRLFILYQDRSGVFWAGTYGGLHYWNAEIGTFSHYKPNLLSNESFLGEKVTAFAESKDAIWVGTGDQGLSRLDRKTDTLRQLSLRASGGRDLARKQITGLSMEREDYLWVGTTNGLDRLNLANESLTSFRNQATQPKSLSHDTVVGLVRDDQDRLWVACSIGGLNLFQPESANFVRYPNAGKADPERFRSMGLFKENSGKLLVSTVGGFQHFNPETGSYTLFSHNPNDQTSLSANLVLSFCEGRDGSLWLGTQGGGLNRWSEADRKISRGFFTHYTSRENLPSNNIYGILEDDNGTLWLSSDQGLASFNYQTRKVKEYQTYRGLQGLMFIPGSAMKDQDGRLYFGGDNGFNVFFPDRIKQNTFMPPVVLTSYSSNTRKKTFAQPYTQIDHIEVGYGDHVITMKFAALEFTRPQANRYMHQLEGFDPGWLDLENLNQVTYTNLPADDYVFKVKAANHDGVWSEEVLAIGLSVESPPWRSPWAYLAYSLMVFFLWGFWLRIQTRKFTLEVERRDHLQQQVRARTRELEQQHYKLEKLNQELEESSLIDQLTGLKNRRYIIQFVQENLFQFEVDDFRDGSLDPEWMFMVVNLDRFRVLNDRFGHATGDMILVQARQILEGLRGESDLLIRWDSDEFMLLVRSPNPVRAKEIAEQVRVAIELHTFTLGNGKSARLTCSIGFAFYPFSPQKPGKMDWHQVMMVSDRALYLAKRNGYNAWAGIICGDCPLSDTFIERLKTSPTKLQAEGAFELLTSIPKDRKLKWN